ncbi:hypothetical protein BDV25DRAFT_159519 [Aspergillus avenaceus]|uniref:FAD/NAD(P)-binding domain-containing protein n=1 Tax=Aspergillus avenaceus TaxID=36643 RepID=A0A5N6TND2_ASPAV|nr:hypothetical protein BDV25DRAFT_159519 [Aspergillus avenaceus]
MLSKIILIFKIFGPVFRQIATLLKLTVGPRLHRLSYRAVEHPRNVVVIGASFAGYHTARCLASSLPTGYRVVVIEKNSHFQLTWVLPRYSVVSGHEHKAFIPYGSYLSPTPEGSYHWIKDIAAKVQVSDEDQIGKVQLGSWEEVEFDYLVLATGASGSLPSRVPVDTKEEGMRLLIAEQDKLRAAMDVVIIGGGAAGIELATDAKSRYPEKNVTLVHSRNTLLSRFGPRIGEEALKELEILGVKVVLGQRVNVSEDVDVKKITLSSGETVACDYLVNCTGQRPNSTLIQSISPTSVSESGHIKVRPTLQIANTSLNQIYAAGDVVDLDNIKNGRAAVQQAGIVAENIVRSIKSQKQREYQPQWWEGTTKLPVGLKKALVWISDGSAEIVMSTKNKAEELDSLKVWKFFGAKPYVDEEKGC